MNHFKPRPLTFIFTALGAAPLGHEHIEALKHQVPSEVRQGWGMTETTSGVVRYTMVSPSLTVESNSFMIYYLRLYKLWSETNLDPSEF